MPRTPPTSSFADSAVLTVSHVRVERDGALVLADASLTLTPASRVGVIGPNGVGKSTLLSVLAGELAPNAGTRTLEPPRASVGYLAQEHRRSEESVHQALARRVGITDAEALLRDAARDLAAGIRDAGERYEEALLRFDALGAGTFDARLATTLGELGVGHLAHAPLSTLSGGQEAKVALAAIELSRFDVVLLDEPTNDLDFAGLERLDEWITRRVGGLVAVSHDRAFLERTVTRVLEIDEHSRTSREYAGGWSGYLSERARALARARDAYEEYQSRRDELSERAARQRKWSASGVRNEKKRATDHDTAQRDFRINRTEQRAAKARQSERALERLEAVDKPFEGWDLRFTIDESARSGEVVLRLDDAMISRGTFTLGPVTEEIRWGERIVLAGPNGAGKTTLLAMVLGDLAPTSGVRRAGVGVVVGTLAQDRRALSDDRDVVRYVGESCGLTLSATRSLLAKFGLGAADVTRGTRTLSPGQRTRVELAVLQARGVNLLVLDEPTNHLDLPAIEQLEAALRNFAGTLVLTTHDRRLLEALRFTRIWDLNDGQLRTRLA